MELTISHQVEMTVIEHLEELRRVIIISLISTVVMAGVCWFFVDPVLEILLAPATVVTGKKMVFISVTEAIFTKIKLALFLGFLTSLPVTLWQLWKFIIPALRKLERVYFTLFVIISFVLFITGVAFGFHYIYRLCVQFLLQYAGNQLVPMLTIGKYVSFTLSFILPFGLIFEMPLASMFLARLGILNYRTMVKGRKIAIVTSVVIASAVVASPEIITVLLFAAPIYLLYEISAILVRLVGWYRYRKETGFNFKWFYVVRKLLRMEKK